MKKYLPCFLSFLALGLLMLPMRIGILDMGPLQGFCLSSFAGALMGYFLLWYFLSKQNSVWTWVAAMAGLFLFTFPMHLINPIGTMKHLLEMVIHFVALFCAFASYRYMKNKYVRYVFTLLVFIGVYGMSVPMYYKWVHYVSFGTPSGMLKQQERADDVCFLTEEGDSIRLSSWRGKTLVLDFWDRRCGICWHTFPQVQALYEKYRDSSDVTVASVFVAGKEDDWEKAREKFRQDYSFPVYHVNWKDAFLEEWKIDRVPTVIILDAEGKMFFRGNLMNAENYLQKAFPVEE